MTKGEGLIALLYAVKDMITDFAMLIITGVAIIAFFWIIVRFIGQKAGLHIGHGNVGPNQMFYAVFILFVIFAVYSLIALTAAIFGVNSGPSGGLLVR